jgi:hypothetical protein
MKTAVEWLYENILLTPLDIRSINKCLEQAKEMEKEQIIEAYNTSFLLRDKPYSTAEKYYNETFNKSIKNKG